MDEVILPSNEMVVDSSLCRHGTVIQAVYIKVEGPVSKHVKEWTLRIKFWQWLFCRWRQFTLRDYFAVSYLWLVDLNDVLNVWLLVILIGQF